MSGDAERLSEGLQHQLEGGLLGDTLGPLSDRAEEEEPTEERPEGAPGDDDGFVGMGPGVDYSTESDAYR